MATVDPTKFFDIKQYKDTKDTLGFSGAVQGTDGVYRVDTSSLTAQSTAAAVYEIFEVEKQEVLSGASSDTTLFHDQNMTRAGLIAGNGTHNIKIDNECGITKGVNAYATGQRGTIKRFGNS